MKDLATATIAIMILPALFLLAIQIAPAPTDTGISQMVDYLLGDNYEMEQVMKAL